MGDKPQDNDLDSPEGKMEAGLNDDRNCKPWKGRSTTEKYVWVFTIILILIFFVLLAFLLSPKGPEIIYRRITGKKMCTTQTCVQEAFRLLNNVDFSLDPCHDFSSLVCKTYDTIPLYISNANENLLSTIRELLEENEDIDELVSSRKAKMFYRSCIRDDEREHNTGSIVRELLKKARMTDGPMQPTENPYSREKTLALLIIYGNKNPFFKFRRTPEFIYLSPGGTVLKSEVLLGETSEHIVERMKYRKLIFNALIKMKIPEESAAEDADNMVTFEITFARSAASAKRTNNISEVALRELEDMFPELKWSVIVRYVYEYYGLESDFSDMLTIRLTCEDYFRKIIHLMSDYDHRALETFIMWSFALHYLPLLDDTFRPFYREIEQVVDTHWKENTYDADWKICSYATMHYFNSPVAHLYYKNKHSEQTNEEIKSMFRDIQSTYAEEVCGKKWMDEKTATQCKTTINETELVIGLPSNIRDLKLVDAMYSLVNVTDDIMENLLTLDKAIFAENVIGTQLTPLYSAPMDADIYYDRGTLTILFGATVPPAFVAGAPRYYNYGWMGFVVAREMWKAVNSMVHPDKASSFQDARELRTVEECLLVQYSGCQTADNGKDKNTKNGMEFVMADQTALLVAAKAYAHYVTKNGEEHSMPGINLSNEQQFFINFGQLMCGSSGENPLDVEDSDFISLNACRLNNIVGNSLEFSETFNCPRNDTRCRIWK